MSFTVFQEVIAQNIFDIAIDSKHATTVIIDSEAKLKVETWNEDYILFQIAFESQSEENETLRYLEINKKHIIQQEFTVNDFLYLTMADLDDLLLANDCKPRQLFTYKIIAPKSLDLELRCENDMVVRDLISKITILMI